jgi:hypothetical protein
MARQANQNCGRRLAGRLAERRALDVLTAPDNTLRQSDKMAGPSDCRSLAKSEAPHSPFKRAGLPPSLLVPRWQGRDSNSRPRAYESPALPLSYPAPASPPRYRYEATSAAAASSIAASMDGNVAAGSPRRVRPAHPAMLHRPQVGLAIPCRSVLSHHRQASPLHAGRAALLPAAKAARQDRGPARGATASLALPHTTAIPTGAHHTAGEMQAPPQAASAPARLLGKVDAQRRLAQPLARHILADGVERSCAHVA